MKYFFNTGLIFTPEVFNQCKKSMGARVEGPGTVNLGILSLCVTVILLINLDLQDFLT